MSNVHTNRPFIVVDCETYELKESNQKPIPEGSALFTLNTIENFVKKYLNDPVAQKELELDLEALKDRIQQIKTGYGQKFEKLCWGTKAAFRVVGLIYSLMNCLFSFARINFRLETEQDLIDKMLVRINNLLQPPTALPPDLVVDVQKEISRRLDFTALCQFALVNRNAYKLTASSILAYARECGFEGESPLEAKAFMKRLLMQVCIVKTNLARQPTYIGGETYSLNTAEEMLYELKSSTTEQMHYLFAQGYFYNNNSKNICPDFRKFLCYIGKEWKKPLALGDHNSIVTSKLALLFAIRYNEPGFVNLFLQHGIEPTDQHLNYSLKEGQDTEVVRLLLDHQASINKEKKYILKGMGSSSLDIRHVFYDFNLNYQFDDNLYLINCLIMSSRFEDSIDWGADLEYVLKSAAEKGLSLGEQIANENLKEEVSSSNLALEFKPLSKKLRFGGFFSDEFVPGNPYPRKDISETVLLLIKYGADRGMALIGGSAFGHIKVVEKMLENSVRGELDMPLWYTCGGFAPKPQPDFSKNLDIVKLLLKHGARTNFYRKKEGDSHEKNALQLAEDNGLTDIAEVLRAHQDNENHQEIFLSCGPGATSHYDSKTETKELAGT